MKELGKIIKLAGWAGILAPVIFVLVFTVEGFIRPDYQARSMYISALSLGPRGWVQIVNFMIFGLLLGFFAWGLASRFRNIRTSRLGIILLWVLSLLFFISGPFVMDPAGTPLDASTVHGLIHGIAGGFVFLLMPITIFAFLRLLKINQMRHFLNTWTIGLGIFEALAVLFFTIVSKNTILFDSFSGWIGLIQRAALIPFMLWLFIFAIGIHRKI